jgi:uncharacterized protein YecT (DUF1311 family)
MRLLAVLALAAGSAGAQPAAQAPAGDPAALRACLDAAERDAEAEAACAGAQAAACLAELNAQTPEALAACAAAEADAWGAALNAVHDEIVGLVRALALAEDPEAVAPGPRELLLQRAQETWAAFREADCAEEAALWEAGAMRDAAAARCRLERTAERTRELLAKRRAHESP